jgi:hypothetical protein
MLELKTIKPEAVSSSLEMAKRYRLLGEPDESASICQDILAVAPDHQEVLITLLLALTDKFADNGLNPSFDKARQTVEKLDSGYCKSYYSGIVFERRAKYHLRKEEPGSGSLAYEWFVKAMEAFDQAMQGCDPDNQDAVLRWNSCALIINSRSDVGPDDIATSEPPLDAFD